MDRRRHGTNIPDIRTSYALFTAPVRNGQVPGTVPGTCPAGASGGSPDRAQHRLDLLGRGGARVRQVAFPLRGGGGDVPELVLGNALVAKPVEAAELSQLAHAL